MRSSRAVSGFVATLILVAISLSLSYVVYEGVSRLAPPRTEVFTNQVLTLGGSPEFLEVEVNASVSSTPQALLADDASSQAGVLYLNDAGYGSTPRLCLPDATTFFSVYASAPGLLQATANGGVWIDGHLTGSLSVGPGWHEVIFSDASSCQVTRPGGSTVAFPGSDVSTIPLIGPVPSEGFRTLIPTDGLGHSLVLVFDGGYDRIA
jgi:hypothetical protein